MLNGVAGLMGTLLLITAAPGAANERLAQAIAADDLSAVRAALDGRAGPGKRPRTDGGAAKTVWAYGESPMLRAVDSGNLDIVEILLQHGAEPGRADDSGLTPLSLACEHGHGAIVHRLLAAGAEVNVPGAEGALPLALCARFAPADTVARLLALGAAPDRADVRGQTALMWAASSGKTEALALLLEAGADVNRVTPAGFTPLFFSIASGNPQAVALLLARGADRSRRGPEQTSALQLAMYQKNWQAGVLLLDGGGDIEEIDRNGNRALHVAAAAGDVPLISALLNAGADPNGLTGTSRITWVTEANFGMPPPPELPKPPLLVAARNGRVETMRLLVAAGADTGFVTGDGTTVLMAAAASHTAAALAYALELAPDPNVTDATGATPLHLVVGGGYHDDLEPMLRALAGKGANPDKPDAAGQSAAQRARDGLSVVRTVFERVFAPTPALALSAR